MGHASLALVIAALIGMWVAYIYIPCDSMNYSLSHKIECAYDRHVDLVRDILFD